MSIKDFVKESVIDSFLGRQDEFKYANVYVEYVIDCELEPVFLVVKECGIDPLLVEGTPAFSIIDYIKLFHEQWMKVLINDITKEVEKNVEPTHIEVMLEDMKKKAFDIGKPKYREGE